MIQDGTAGLVKAVERFDPEKVRLTDRLDYCSEHARRKGPLKRMYLKTLPSGQRLGDDCPSFAHRFLHETRHTTNSKQDAPQLCFVVAVVALFFFVFKPSVYRLFFGRFVCGVVSCELGFPIQHVRHVVGAPGHPLRLRGLREGGEIAHEPSHDGVQGDEAADGYGGPAGETADRAGAIAGERARRAQGI